MKSIDRNKGSWLVSLIIIPFFIAIAITGCSEQGTVGSASDSSIVNQVVTIYFAGTTMDSTMWNPANSPFKRAETVASLHHFQKTETGNNYSNHHKAIIDGFSDLQAAFPDWDAKSQEAKDLLSEIIDTFGEEESIMLNLVC